MRPDDAYVITEPVREEASVAIYHGLRVRDQQPVLIKTLGPQRRRPRDIERLRNEFDIASRLDIPSVVRPLALDTYRGAPALILTAFVGSSLEHWQAGAPVELEPFLRMAATLARAVAEVHALGVVHKDIKPQNILVHAGTGEVKLMDFELASLLPREQPVPVGARLIEGSLPYMSPEQTGRTNQAIDYRSDLYSLGVTLYQLRAGRLPFQAGDPLGWIHCHLAHTPPLLSQTAPGTPEIVANIVAKLLAKAPEDRYQSARGLQHDLELCLERWAAEGQIAPFALAEHDVSDQFRIPQRLYGRQAESAALVAAFERMLDRGAPGLVLISGYAGVGKTTLVQELHKPVVRERGFLATGSFDRHSRRVPYSSLVEAWQGLLHELLSEPQEEIARWRQRFGEALGADAALLVEVLPELELLIGPQPAAGPLPLAEAERRFQTVARQFVGVLAAKQHPLVLLLDDLQWADSASLKLIETMLGGDIGHLLIIGTYRDNEVPPSHLLHDMVERTRQAGTPIVQIFLGPLSRGDVDRLVAATVGRGLREAGPLAHLIHETTAGNPLFVNQLLTSLHEQAMLHLDRRSGGWRWDLDEIRPAFHRINIVDLMVTRLNALPQPTRHVLERLACCGNQFDVEGLASICGRSVADLGGDLWEAVRAGVIVRADGAYRFVHDRVREATYSFVAAERRGEWHLEIGRRLLAATPDEAVGERVFDIVGQLNRSVELIDAPDERDRLARLNLLAGQRARSATAYASAGEFLAQGIALLGADPWQRQYPLCFRLHLEQAECEYLNNALEGAERLTSLLIERAQGRIDRAAVYALAVQLHATKGEVDRSLANTLACLRDFGIQMPRRPTRAQVEEEYQRLLADVQVRGIETLVDLPLLTDPETMALMSVLTVSTAPAYFVDFEVYASLVGLSARVTLEHGNTHGAAHIYTAFGALVGVIFGRYDEARRLGEVGLALLGRRGLAASRARALYVFAGFISHWVEPIDRSIARMHEAIAASVESGNVNFASYSALTLVAFRLLKGDRLDEVQREIDQRLETTIRARAQIVISILGANRFFVEFMRGTASQDEQQLEQQLLPVPLVLFNHHLRMLQAHLILGQHAQAGAAVARAEPLAWSAFTLPHFADFVFFRALLATQTGVRLGLDDCQRRLALWAESCPSSFAARARLVAAEVARLDGRPLEAMQLYQRAINEAEANGLVHVEALARELAAAFYQQQGIAEFARLQLREARACYLRWGADAKVRALDREHGAASASTPPVLTTFIARTSALDLMSVLKASQTISAAIDIDDLARTLMRVVLEHGGGQRACLIVERQGTMSIEAAAELDASGVRVELRPADSLESVVPATFLNHAARTGDRVILNDASADRLAADPYLARFRPCSALCLPILLQGRALGYLYLENALVPGVFTGDRLMALELLASQAAISLENAHLLRQELAARRTAEASIKVREEFLTVASHELRTPIATLMLQVESLRDEWSSGTAAAGSVTRSLEVIRRQGLRLQHEVEDLLDVTRIEAGLLRLDLKEFDLGELVRDVLSSFELGLQRARCVVELDATAPVRGRWDRSRLEQVVSNLISNALRFGAGRPIAVSVERRAATAQLVVRDHGRGIDPAQHARIFERFTRAVPVDHFGGLGLGLYICQQIVAAHRGRIHVASRPGEGATFTVELPLSA